MEEQVFTIRNALASVDIDLKGGYPRLDLLIELLTKSLAKLRVGDNRKRYADL